MNSSSKRALLFFAFALVASVVPFTARALDITAFYIGSCKRIVGIPLDISSDSLKVLSVDGRIQEIPRYEANYVASYPVDVVPFTRVQNIESVRPVRIFTRQNRQIVELLSGWPVEFSEDKIAFLTLKGDGAVVDKSTIWRIESIDSDGALSFDQKRVTRTLELVHPQTFSSCEPDVTKTSTGEAPRRIVAQQLLSEPVTIKREFDRLQRGHELIDAYERRQKFYPVPNLYENQTSLMLWTSSGSRYGSSTHRSNNFTPLVRSEKSTGPFSYQHQILTGSGPNPESAHEEPQTQAAYRFKADYFQFSVMSDLSFLLIGGDKYRWSRSDLDDRDFRISDVARIAVAFDYGAFSLNFMPVSAQNTGMSYGAAFVEDSVNIARSGLTYRHPDLQLDFSTGSGTGSKVSMDFLRVNASYRANDLTWLRASYIRRASTLGTFRDKTFELNSLSSTYTASIEHLFHERFPLGAFGSYEALTVNAGPLGSTPSSSLGANDRAFLKFGVMFGLVF